MFRRHLLAWLIAAAGLGAAAAPLFVQPSLAATSALPPDDKALVDRAAAYLDGLTEARARFVQTDFRGQTSEGELDLSRPGKARFEYQKPPYLLMVADGFAVVVLDRRLNTCTRYPVGSTPLGLFLQKHVRLDKVDITGVDQISGGFSITARSGRRGQITMTFADNPIALRQWSIIDAQGRRTTVNINGLEPAHGLDPQLFRARCPERAG